MFKPHLFVWIRKSANIDLSGFIAENMDICNLSVHFTMIFRFFAIKK